GGRGEPQFGPWPTLERPRVGFEAQGWPTRLGLVAAGLGVCVLPGFAVGILPHRVVWRAVHDPEFRRWRETVVLTREEPSRNAQAMLRAVKAAFEDPQDGPR
ncbi:LysR substrate-binding domain-containing protein, partial [Nocardiopsis sp. MG754419]|uniref:LysR substrate-binding domain-containing protein n=1 Tax=Nocardiopsis sp. MG754419 TaxID=2259865 RepID=UPI00201225A1